MNWVSIVLLVINLLRSLRKAATFEEFSTTVSAYGQLPSANGDFLKWLWENKEQIIEFVKVIIGLFPAAPPATTQTLSEVFTEMNSFKDEMQS